MRRHTSEMAALTSFHAEKCCHLMNVDALHAPAASALPADDSVYSSWSIVHSYLRYQKRIFLLKYHFHAKNDLHSLFFPRRLTAIFLSILSPAHVITMRLINSRPVWLQSSRSPLCRRVKSSLFASGCSRTSTHWHNLTASSSSSSSSARQPAGKYWPTHVGNCLSTADHLTSAL